MGGRLVEQECLRLLSERGSQIHALPPPETARIDRSASPPTSVSFVARSTARRSWWDSIADRLRCAIRPIATISRTVKSNLI